MKDSKHNGNYSKQGMYQDKGLPPVAMGQKCGSSGFDGMPSGKKMPMTKKSKNQDKM